MAPRHVLLLGGNGKIAQLLTPLLLQRSWNVTSIIRNTDQVAMLQKLGENLDGKLNVRVWSLEDVKSDAQAKSLLDEVKPDYVIWSAGAGGKGAPERTFAIDRDAAVHFVQATAATPSITRFLMISHIGSRQQKPAWWDDATWQNLTDALQKNLKRYHEAKLVADEVLYKESKKGSFVGINLRPGTLTDEPAGRVQLGRLPKAQGRVSRASVAEVAALLLDSENVKNCWIDMLDGDEDAVAAVQRVVDNGVNDAEGEPYF